jgi:hypothetical protein
LKRDLNASHFLRVARAVALVPGFGVPLAAACSTRPPPPYYGGADAGVDAPPVNPFDGDVDGDADSAFDAGISGPTCTKSADCMTGEICCATINATTACQTGPCPSTPIGPLELCATSFECPAGDTCGPTSSALMLPIMICRAPFDAGAEVVVLAPNEQNPSYIAVDGQNLYWTALDVGRTCIVKMPLTGGTPVTLAVGPGTPFGLAVDSANAYWTQSVSGGTSSVVSVPLDGGPSVPIAVGTVPLVGPAIDSTGVYWTENVNDAGRVMRAPLDGAAPSALAVGLNAPNALAVDSASVYWLSLDGIFRAPLDGGVPTLLAPPVPFGPNLTGAIAVDVNAVYSSGAGPFCSLQRTPLDGGTPELLSVAPPGAGNNLPVPCLGTQGSGIASDGMGVYLVVPFGGPSSNAISVGSGEIVRVRPDLDPDASGAIETIAIGLNGPSSVVVDATHVYWTNSGGNGETGQVMMAPK